MRRIFEAGRIRCMVALGVLGMVACADAPAVHELRLEPVADHSHVDPATVDSTGARGRLRLTPSSPGHVSFTVSLVGLEPDATYALCLNAQEASSPSSDTLGSLGMPAWPLGGFYPSWAGGVEGYWDFEKVQSDSQGRYLHHFELPLPAQPYRVKFLVKIKYDSGARTILTSQPLLLDVRAPLDVYVLTGIAVLAVMPVALILLRWSRRTGECPDETDAGHQEAGPILEADSQNGLACAQTSVERARAEGLLLHHKNYAWIEIRGRRKRFRARQALVFRILCERDPNCEGMPQEEIVKAWEEQFGVSRANPVRVRDIFRSCEHEPGDFIVRVAGRASMYRLRLEPTPPPPSYDLEKD